MSYENTNKFFKTNPQRPISQALENASRHSNIPISYPVARLSNMSEIYYERPVFSESGFMTTYSHASSIYHSKAPSLSKSFCADSLCENEKYLARTDELLRPKYNRKKIFGFIAILCIIAIVAISLGIYFGVRQASMFSPPVFSRYVSSTSPMLNPSSPDAVQVISTVSSTYSSSKSRRASRKAKSSRSSSTSYIKSTKAHVSTISQTFTAQSTTTFPSELTPSTTHP
eukprot:Sdes_comp13781_c0_seq1m3288